MLRRVDAALRFPFRDVPRLLRSSSSSSTSSPNEGETPRVLRNRNPRNLESMRIGYKPDGYHLEKKDKSYWHKLELNEERKCLTARVYHYMNGLVLEASTGEMALRKRLYRPTDTSAHANLGRLFAERCLRAGISQMFSSIEAVPGGKVEKFLEAVREGGVILEESDRYKKPYPWDRIKPEKPWEISV